MYKQVCNLKKSWIIIIFFILLPVFLFSQVTTSWVARYDGPISSEDVAYAMVIDEYSNVYVTGKSMGSGTDYDFATIKYVQVTGTYEEEVVSDQILLFQNYPNPFNPSGAGRSPYTTISFNLTAENAEIVIYNLKGQKIRTFLFHQFTNSPINHVTWDGTDEEGKSVTSGVYFYRLKAGEINIVRKMLLIK